ncbi:MAG: ATP-dependent zinc metalloprotease FtsH, partial [Oscillospiraceae bacterium]|nr:ATP-dependent zinc metalloprotease FtsH [Oscillospiraceae bacterium]
DLFRQQKVSEFSLDISTGQLSYSVNGAEEPEMYRVPSVDLFIYDIRQYINDYNDAHPNAPIKYTYYASASITSILIEWMPVILSLLMMVVFFLSMRQQGGGRVASIGRARVGKENEGRKATFADVAGCDEEKEELQEIIEYLKAPQRFSMLGAKIPKGVLLVGPPGTGKTLLARAVAGEAGVPFLSISGSDFVELYVGVGASRVRDLFDRAKRERPCIIFIDEIDAVGRQRGAGLGGGHDEREQTLNQLLVEMDGFAGNEGVIVIAATNRADILDHALLRPGRFDRQIYVGLPDVKGREEILKVHAKGKPLGPDVDLKTIAKGTVGFTGADLENLLNEAALLAARKQKKAITQEEIEEATIKVIAGPEKKSRVVTEKEKKLTAYHEAGHAVTTFYRTPESPVHQISIIPRGMAGGYTMSLPDEDVNYQTKNDMLGEITTLLGGRVAEELVLDDISTGASNDLERATKIARNMVTKYGFSDKLGPVVYGDQAEVFLGRDFTQSRNYSEQIATDIDEEIKDIVEKCYVDCRNILSDHMDKLNAVAEALLIKEKLDDEEFKSIMSQNHEEIEAAETDLSAVKEDVFDSENE